ncbi:MAG: hypothetical protein ACR2NM_15270 [Bythopirellula sp.]
MMMVTRRRSVACLALLSGLLTGTTWGQETREVVRDGVRYQETRRVTQRQVPVTVMQNQNQMVYTQQLTTNTLNHQQLYCVPTTSYQWDSRLRGRWNPFVTPYWTYNLRPVTTWNTQLANVQIPVNKVAWVPQTRTVQVPVTTYRTAEEETVTRVAMNNAPSSTALASAQPQTSGPSATIAARPGTTLGGVRLQNDPPRQATGWQQPATSVNRY